MDLRTRLPKRAPIPTAFKMGAGYTGLPPLCYARTIRLFLPPYSRSHTVTLTVQPLPRSANIGINAIRNLWLPRGCVVIFISCAAPRPWVLALLSFTAILVVMRSLNRAIGISVISAVMYRDYFCPSTVNISIPAPSSQAVFGPTFWVFIC